MRWVLLLTLAICGRPTPADYNQKWTGAPEDDIVLHFGRPHDVIVLPSGNRILAYHSQAEYAAATGATAYTPASARAGTAFCDKRFEIDPNSRRVVRASISGNSCDYSR